MRLDHLLSMENTPKGLWVWRSLQIKGAFLAVEGHALNDGENLPVTLQLLRLISLGLLAQLVRARL